jgi:putative ATP-binding cassette transporter
VDWSHEWIASLVWSAKILGITLIVTAAAVWLLVRFTSWGRQFWRLTGSYFRPRGSWVSWRPLVTLVVMLWLTIVAVRLVVLFSEIVKGFGTAFQQLNAADFWRLLGIFGVLATIAVILAVVTALVVQAFIIQWRVWLNDRMVGDWLDGSAYHRGQFAAAPVDNPDQRIEQDVNSFTANSQSLFFGTVRAILSLVAFTVILWQLSGPLALFGYTFPRAMVFLAYLYVIVASLIAFRIGRPLVRLYFREEKLGASFRYALVRLRDHSENVAFYRGEGVERATLESRFAAVIANRWAIVFRSVKFEVFNVVVDRIAAVFPIVVQAPQFFSRAIDLGSLNQTVFAFDRVHAALSFFRNAYDEFASYRATLTRLTGLLDANSQTRALPSVAITDRADELAIEDLTVRRPGGQPLIADLSLHVDPGQSLLVTGASGVGKTTLLRSLAGLWPYAQGTVRRPTAGHTLFLSQQPYVPLGSLRGALTYPQSPRSASDEKVREVLRMVQLGHLEDRVDDEADWLHILSPGEQQRFGFARILVNRPQLVFLDEATSAVDEGTEHALYTLLRRELSECMLVSVGHRSTLPTFHTHQLELLGEGQWDVTVVQRDVQRGSD